MFSNFFEIYKRKLFQKVVNFAAARCPYIFNDTRRGVAFGQCAEDVVTLGNVKTKTSVDFGLMSKASEYFIKNPVDGVLGLGCSTSSSQLSGVYRFLKEHDAEDQHFTVYQKKGGNILAEKTGVITLGESDLIHCSESGQSFSIALGVEEWRFQLVSVVIGTDTTNNNREVIVDPSIERSIFPLTEFLIIKTVFKAQQTEIDGPWYTTCKSTYPKVILRNGDAELVISSNKIVEKVRILRLCFNILIKFIIEGQ